MFESFMIKAIFIDRDGVMVKESGFITKKENVNILPKTLDFLKESQRKGFINICITNQPAIARGLVLDPQILLMDEPFAALDAQTRELLYEELQIIWERTSKTIMFVTHNVREAACLADRIILMSPHPGQIYKEYRVDQPRPRVIEDLKVMEVARTIHADLKQITSIHQDGEKQ